LKLVDGGFWSASGFENPVLSLKDKTMISWISRHRLLTVVVFVILISLSIAISATETNPVSRFILRYFDNWSAVFRTVGTLTAAYLAYVAIIEGQHIREEARDLEHKRRSLEDIIAWTRNLQKLCFQRSSSRQIEEVQSIIAAGDWAVMTAGIFGQEFKNLVNKLRNEIASCTMEIANIDEIASSDTMIKSVNDVLEAAFKLKIMLKI
jgi:hypothetical protein